MPIRTARSALLCATLLAGLFVATGSRAEGLRPASLFVQGGGGESGLRAAGIGLLWPWAWRTQALGGEFSLQTELFASHWRARGRAGNREGFTQVGLLPLLRLRLDEGRSPWFIEGGIGLSLTDRLFVTPARRMGSRWNFSDNLALGRQFGAGGQHELSLRWQHTSNAGLKQPNPGVDLVMLRWSSRF